MDRPLYTLQLSYVRSRTRFPSGLLVGCVLSCGLWALLLWSAWRAL